MNGIGGIGYGHAVTVLCFLAIVYYTAFYGLIRLWLGVLPAAFGVLVAVKLQLFNAGINPLIWAYPDRTVLRHLLDVAVFLSMLMYARGRGERFLWLCSISIGISLAFVLDTGIYMLVALWGYLTLLLFFKETRDQLCPTLRSWRKIMGLGLLPVAVMLFVLALFFGNVVFHEKFWADRLINLPGWFNGMDAISIYSCLRDRNFFAFFASFALPVIYAMGSAAAIRSVGGRQFTKDKLFIVPLSVYGLGIYGHFLWHGSMNEYYLAPLPLVGCVGFWGMQLINAADRQKARFIKVLLVMLAFVALLTNVLFTYYPHLLNMNAENWEQEKNYVQVNFNFKEDSDLLHALTSPDQKVALISGFETQILLQAKRTPFFYKSLTLLGAADVDRMIVQVDEDKPPLVFVNKNVFGTSGLDALVNDLKAHYHFTGQQSVHLIALQRNHE